MRTKHKLFVDKVIGLPLSYSVNAAARILGFFFNMDHSLDKQFKTIAVSKFIGLGSIIQATPLLQTLRINYPEAKLIFITNEPNKKLFDHIPFVDEVLTLSDKNISSLISTTLSLICRLWNRKIGLYIDLEIYSNFSSIITTFSLAKNRLGFFKSDKTYRMGMYTHMMFFNMKAPISEIYLQFARLSGCKEIVSELYQLKIGEDKSRAKAERIKSIGLNPSDKYIVVNPNASDLRIERRWDIKNFISLIERIIIEMPDYKICLIGSKSEMQHVGMITHQIKDKHQLIDFSGKLTFAELIFLINNSELIITNDTGPMHIAFALRKKTVALFGPCSPEHYGNVENCFPIYKNIYCSPCVHEFIIPMCKGDNQCMKKIMIEEVWQTILQAINKSEHPMQTPEIVYTNEFINPLGVVSR